VGSLLSLIENGDASFALVSAPEEAERKGAEDA
jgi:hypothetical protein